MQVGVGVSNRGSRAHVAPSANEALGPSRLPAQAYKPLRMCFLILLPGQPPTFFPDPSYCELLKKGTPLVASTFLAVIHASADSFLDQDSRRLALAVLASKTASFTSTSPSIPTRVVRWSSPLWTVHGR